MSLCDEIVKRFSESDRPELQKRVAGALNSKAWTIYLRRDFSRVDEAIQLASKAIALLSQNAIHHTLASLFGMTSRWEEAFAQTGFFLNDEEMLKNFPEDIISFIVEAVADGQAERALQAMEGTKAESIMEPLLVALKMLTNTPFRAPQEVIEVANDVVKRIEERAKELKKEGVKLKASFWRR